jgi:hypothetical protein
VGCARKFHTKSAVSENPVHLGRNEQKPEPLGYSGRACPALSILGLSEDIWNKKKETSCSSGTATNHGTEKEPPLAFSQDMLNHRFFPKALDTLPKALEEGLL